MRRHMRFAVSVSVLTCGLALVAIEVVLRVRHPEMTHGALLERVLRERYTWRRPDAEFHHVGEGIFELAGLQPSLTPITSDELAAPAARPAYSVMENRALKDAGLAQARPWEDALADYLREKGHLQAAAGTES